MSKCFKNVGGSHETADGVLVPSGATIVSDVDLSVKFPNAFVEVIQHAAPVNTPAPESESVVIEDDDIQEPTTPDGHEDVTADFPEAVEGGITVTRNKAGWWFYDGDPEPVNEKPLKKKEVGSEITAYLGA